MVVLPGCFDLDAAVLPDCVDRVRQQIDEDLADLIESSAAPEAAPAEVPGEATSVLRQPGPPGGGVVSQILAGDLQ